ncbi:hypothetical protein BDK51DRAFT_32192, partial [Blyttiomyces helicus]
MPTPPASLPRTPPSSQSQTGLFYDTRMLAHENLFQANPVERPDRIRKTFDALSAAGLADRCHRIKLKTDLLSKEEIAFVHDKEHVDRMEATAAMNEADLRITSQKYNDVFVNSSSFLCAQVACSGLVKLCEAVMRGEVGNGLAIVRPPGHHAEQDEPMGFCIFNNVAIATKLLHKNGTAKRTLIIDWDIHHGNGTQKIFYDDPNVFYISLHRYEGGAFFPYLRIADADHTGGEGAKGRNMNIPWPGKGLKDVDYVYAFNRLVSPEFQRRGDPLGECDVTPEGYAMMTHMLQSLADGRVVVCLEGGYNLNSVSQSLVKVASVLLGDAPTPVHMADGPSHDCIRTVQRVAEIHSQYWKCLRPTHVEGGSAERPSINKPAIPLQGVQIFEDPFEVTLLTAPPLTDIISLHRSITLTTTLGMRLVEVKAPATAEIFRGRRELAQSQRLAFLLCSPEVFRDSCKLCFDPNIPENSGRLDPLTNVLDISNAVSDDAGMLYIEDIIRNQHSLIDIEVDTSVFSQYDVMLLAVREVVNHVWDSLAG